MKLNLYKIATFLEPTKECSFIINLNNSIGASGASELQLSQLCDNLYGHNVKIEFNKGELSPFFYNSD